MIVVMRVSRPDSEGEDEGESQAARGSGLSGVQCILRQSEGKGWASHPRSMPRLACAK